MTCQCKHNKIVAQSQIPELREVCQQILAAADEYGYSKDDTFAIHLAMEEAFINAVKHGNANDPEKLVTIEYDVSAKRVEIIVSDQGAGFEPEKLDDPRKEKNLFKISGRGVLLIRSYMDSVEYLNNGSCLRMVKKNHKSADSR